MKVNRAVIAAIVVLVLIAAGWWLFSRRGAAESVDLLALYPQAKKQPSESVLQVVDVTLNGETKRAIVSNGASRITWHVRIPDDAWLRVDVGMKPEVWEAQGEGAYFFVLVSDGRSSEQLFSQHVHPYANTADRKWMPAFVDLSAYAGEDVELVFNTRTSAERTPEDPRNDLALWGAPEIVIR